MTQLDCAEIPIYKRAHVAVEPPIMISQSDSRQGSTGHRALYVLGFGIAGAIFANMLAFIYFISFYASG